MPLTALHWKLATVLALTTFLSFIYFYEGGGWNQNSRFDLLRAIIERHTLQIDAYHENTNDKAHFRGHYYSDKAPGQVFLALPFAFAAPPAMQALGVDPQSARGEYVLSYIVTVCTTALPTALAAMCLFFLALRFGCDPTAAAFGTMVTCLATPLWAYATVFWAHALVGSCLVFAFGAALKLRDSTTARGDFFWSLATGLAAGWATVTEYPAAPASAILALFALSQAWHRGAAARWRTIASVGVGAAFCIVVLLSYLYAAFGSFRPSYSYYDPNSFTWMQQRGFLGITYPHPDRLLKLLFQCRRGLFFASPVSIAAIPGLWWLWKRPTHRAAALTAAAISAYYFLFNAAFYEWKGGQAFGPRYASACVPILCMGIVVAWQYTTPVWRRILMVLTVFSLFIVLMVVSTSSQLSMIDSCPIIHTSWPQFWSGQVASNRESMLVASESNGGYGAFNLGQLIGLTGLASLLPLLLMWIVAGAIWWRLHSKSENKPM
jgi:hypothetical protein